MIDGPGIFRRAVEGVVEIDLPGRIREGTFALSRLQMNWFR
jgi:hypothetical protein